MKVCVPFGKSTIFSWLIAKQNRDPHGYDKVEIEIHNPAKMKYMVLDLKEEDGEGDSPHLKSWNPVSQSMWEDCTVSDRVVILLAGATALTVDRRASYAYWLEPAS